MTEAEVQAQGMAYLSLQGALVVRCNSGAMKVGKRYIKFNNQPGQSDTLVCLKGRFIGIEFKATKAPYKAQERRPWGEPYNGPLTRDRLHLEEQRSFLESVIQAGGIGFFARSLQEVIDRLIEEGLL